MESSEGLEDGAGPSGISLTRGDTKLAPMGAPTSAAVRDGAENLP